MPIGTYGLLMLAGFAAAMAISLLRGRRRGIAAGDMLNYCALAGAGAAGGALLAGYLLFMPERLASPHVHYPPAFVSWGGIAGGVAALLFASWRWKASFLELADIGTPGYLVGLGIGRIGCFFAGCCYGVHTDSRIGVVFTDPAAPASAMTQPLVPTQLISAAFLLTAGVLFLLPHFGRLRSGSLFALSAVAYALFRFTIELWRDDPRAFLWGLSDGQLFSLAYCATGLGLLWLIHGSQAADRCGR